MATNGVSESTDSIEIKIKTLDGQTYNLRVDKSVPVPQLKDKIAELTGIESNQQRLICRGKVLGDDDNLSHYHVEEGHTLHLVVKQPPESSPPNPGTESMSDTRENLNIPGIESIVMGTFNIDQRRGFSNIGPIISGIMNTIAAGGPNTFRTEAGGTNDESGSESPQANANPNPNPTVYRVDIDSMQGLSETPIGGSLNPSPIPNSLTTISQYLEFMNEEFRRAGFGANNYSSFGYANGMQGVSNLSQAAQSTRTLMVQARQCLSQLAEQLSDQTNVTEESSRAQLQQLSMRSGVLMQNLGSLLLEFGRTAMMFHAGPTPQEASVNAGPAVFISGSGPNPLMVQPVPFFPGSSSVIGGQTGTGGVQSAQTGGLHSGQPSQPDPIRSARPSIDIHIRTGRLVQVQTETDSVEQQQEQEAGTESQEQTNPAGNGNSAVQALRNMVQMMTVPVLHRPQQPPAGTGEGNNNHVQANGGEENSFENFSSMLNDMLGRALNGGHIHSTPIPPSNPPPISTTNSVQVGFPQSQTNNNSEEGVQFSNLLRQVLPAVSEMIIDSSSPPSRNINITSRPSFHQADSRNLSNNGDPFEFDEGAQPPPRIIRVNRRRLSDQARNPNDSNNPDDSTEGPGSKRQRNNQ